VPPEHQREPLRFVVGEGWTSLEDEPAASPAAASEPATPKERRRWSRDERVSLAVALLAAVFAGIAIAIAPLFS
jgi:ferric-dicitrate binding protein FerR (iron transport regulator)